MTGKGEPVEKPKNTEETPQAPATVDGAEGNSAQAAAARRIRVGMASANPRRDAELLAGALDRQARAMRAAWIELHRGDPSTALKWLASALPQFNAGTGWDGRETGRHWHDRTSGAQAPGRPAPWAGLDQAWQNLPGVPARDDPELTVLMEAVRRLPRDRADLAIEGMLRCALGYERTSEPQILARQAASALATFRSRRNPDDQKALDATPLAAD
jgi:hypothetical protein